jgi:hypothetical protein
MKHVQYMGPADSVEIEGYGVQRRGEVKKYPGRFAMHLLRSSIRDRFRIMHVNPAPEIEIKGHIEMRPDHAEPGIQEGGGMLEPAIENMEAAIQPARKKRRKRTISNTKEE